VVGVAYTPNDGVINPTGLTNALAAGAKQRGARIFQDTNVKNINLKDGRVHEVINDKGSIQTEIVVNAAGHWSGEISPNYTPYEAGLGFAIKLDKGDFIGRKALLGQKESGIKQKLCCLTLSDSRTVALGKEPIRTKDGKIIGWVASGGYGYSVGKSILYAYLPIEYSKTGTELEVEFFGEQVGAVVAQAPLWDPKGERIKA
jgi:glycine cleavage system aminomethyltransferase T